MKIDFYSVECTHAISFLFDKHGRWPSARDFEKEFRCKVMEEHVLFNSMRDYTWFILKWGSK